MPNQTDINKGPTSGYNLPADSAKHIDEYIVFFSDDKKPKILFHSIDPNSVYLKADDIHSKTGKIPTIVKVSSPRKDAVCCWLHAI